MNRLNQPIIRQFNKDHTEAYLKVIQEAFKTVADALQMTKAIFPASGAFFDKNGFYRLLNKGAHMYGLYVMVDQSEVLAGCIAFSSKDGNVYKIMKLAILPDYRHLGYGSYLMAFIEDKILSLGGKVITLGMVSENQVLKSWYQAKGFEITKTKAYKKTNYNICFMEKNLVAGKSLRPVGDRPTPSVYRCHTHESEALVWLLTHERERARLTNTGQLIKDVLPNSTEVFYWSRVEADQRFLDLLKDDLFYPVLVFPAYGEPRKVIDPEALRVCSNKRLAFVILDGTWKEARKMLRKSPYLESLPYVALKDLEKTRYTLRRNKDIDHICTVEVAIELYKLLGKGEIVRDLTQHFLHFLDTYHE
jgi:DTW domain-containing protein YfiP/ribosomal protein S18 acetylase RimI-like enzyme